ncbi:MAG: PrsW family intramembrane metalloprotease [Deltaproteobacteria bacterium]|nr:PrsW family intramembrane metalloprotease [Deltaproteobacteria bacterium]
MSPLLLILALAPPLAMVWFFQSFKPAPPEKPGLLAILFISGLLSGLPALFLNHMVEKYTALWAGAPEIQHRLLFWMLGIGWNEELAKLLPLLALLYFRKDFTTPYQGLLGGITVALGFSAVENIFYLDRFGTVTLLVRSILTVPAHAFFTAPLGLCLAYSKNAAGAGAKYGWLLGGLLVSMVFHGTYDIWLSFEYGWINRLAYLQVLLMGLFTLLLMRIARQAPIDRQTGAGIAP